MSLAIAVTPLIESGLNQVLKFDPESPARLRKLDGKIIALHVTDLGLAWQFVFQSDFVQVLVHSHETPDTVIEAKSIDLIAGSLARRQSDAVLAGKIQIHGDIDAGQQFQALFQSLDIDWEEQVSKFTGDIIAHGIGNFVRSFQQQTTHSHQSFKESLSEYALDDAEYVPHDFEIQQFNQQIDQTRDDVERLSLRIDRLLKKIESKTT